MEPSKNFEDLIVWRKAHQFALGVYGLTKTFPGDEMYGLTSQFRRASVSVAANIAEAFKRKSIADKLRMLNIAQGSLEECRYYIILSRDLSYGFDSALQTLANEVSKVLTAYMKSIRQVQQK